MRALISSCISSPTEKFVNSNSTTWWRSQTWAIHHYPAGLSHSAPMPTVHSNYVPSSRVYYDTNQTFPLMPSSLEYSDCLWLFISSKVSRWRHGASWRVWWQDVFSRLSVTSDDLSSTIIHLTLLAFYCRSVSVSKPNSNKEWMERENLTNSGPVMITIAPVFFSAAIYVLLSQV